MRSSGILSPPKTPESRQSSPQEEEPEETFATRAKELAENKAASKFVRVLTVLAYVLSVSMAAILLSLYYVLVWDPPKPSMDPETPSAFRDERDNLTYDILGYNENRTLLIEKDYDGHSHTAIESATFPFQLDNTFNALNTLEDEVDLNTLETLSFNDTDQTSMPSITTAPEVNPLEFRKNNSLLLKKIIKNMQRSKTSNDT